MGNDTIIAWTDHTFNPWMGCTKVSDGCKNCYAATLTKNRMGLDIWGASARRQVTSAPWRNVKKWNTLASHGVPGLLGAGSPHLVFTGSLMDWAEDRSELDAVRVRLFDLIRESPNLIFQLLTKRPWNIESCLPKDWGRGWHNVWLGTSVENMAVMSRADELRKVPAAIRFISYEPALGPLDDLNLSGIDWVIYGGESGPNYRPENKDWARAMRDRCLSEGVAFFHKQSSGYRTELGIELDGKTIRNFPDWEAARRNTSQATFALTAH